MKNKIIIISTILLLVIIFISGLLFIKYNINKSKKEEIKYQKEFDNNYNNFIKNIEEYNKKRDNLNNLSKLFYYDNLNNNYDDLYKFYTEYDLIVGKIYELNKNMNKECNYIFDNRCNNYIESYNLVINTYKEDVGKFNDLIKLYNENKKGNYEYFKSKYINNE